MKSRNRKKIRVIENFFEKSVRFAKNKITFVFIKGNKARDQQKETKMATANTTLEITQVQIFPIPEAMGKLKAFARILVADQLLLTSLRIYEGTKGLFVSYPNDPMHKGEDYRQLFYPVNKEFRDAIEKAVLDEYNRQLSGTAN